MSNLILTPQQMRALVTAIGGKNRQEQADNLKLSRAMLTIYLRDGVTVKAGRAIRENLVRLAKRKGIL